MGTKHGAPMAFIDQLFNKNRPAVKCITWPFGTTKGAGVVWVDGRMDYAARVVCERRHGPPPSPTHQAAHSCGRGHLGCINPAHISWKTPKDNMADQLAHGTRPLGERRHNAKLTLKDVRAIRRLLMKKTTQQKIADRFGVTRNNIQAISAGKSWARLT